MKKILVIGIIIAVWLASCEDIYNPEMDAVEDLLVVEANLIFGQSNNSVKLYKTINFNASNTSFPPVNGAIVMLIDQIGASITLTENGKTGIYSFNGPLDQNKSYKLYIRHEGEIIESAYQAVPKWPEIDSVYTEHTEKMIVAGTDASSGKLRKEPGAMVYVDIADKGDVTHYRFSHRKIVQYAYNAIAPSGPPIEGTMYAWMSLRSREMFNIAAPPEYSLSTDIKKHPLIFLEQRFYVQIPDTPTYFIGWIYISHQYAISEQTYHYYKDLNSQLTAEGKLFDPLYTQARGNIACITDPKKIILGNFEISTVREHRFYVQPMSNNSYFIKRIPYFWYIPDEGKSFNQIPEWWEFRGKIYP
jgi:hypothetical protein